MYVCMYVCISADCTMQFYDGVCISATLALYNPMLVYVCPSRLHNYCAIQWPKCATGTITAPDYCLAGVTRILWKNTTHKHFKSLPRSLPIAYNFSDTLKTHLNVCQLCCPFKQSDSIAGLSKDSLPNGCTSRGCACFNCYSPRRVTRII